MEKENKIKDSPDPICISNMNKILEQMMKCICKIKTPGKSGTGFFCKISYEKNNIIALLTNYHVLNEKYYNNNKELRLLINDEKEAKILDLTKKRRTYFNENYDVTIIELKIEDDINNYLELDDNIFKTESKAFYEDKSIYLLQYPRNNIMVSYGVLTKINNYDILHKCSTEKGSSGSPILNINTNKVIGIHKEGTIFNFNKGTLLKFPLNDFLNKNKNIFINLINDNINFNNKNNVEDNININYKKYMMKVYDAKMINTYINKMIEDETIYDFIIDIFNSLQNRIIKWENFIKIRDRLICLRSFDFTKDKNLSRKTIVFIWDTGHRIILIFNYGTTIQELVENFFMLLIKNDYYFPERKKVWLLYNGMRLKESDKTLIEEFFKNNDCPSVLVIGVYLNYALGGGYDSDSD